jgi:signal peptide peptidase SppA
MRPSIRLLGELVNTPLMAHPRKAAAVYTAVRAAMQLPGMDLPNYPEAHRIDALHRPAANASAFIGSQPVSADDTSWMRREPYRLQDGVAIITTTGSLVNRGAWIGDDGSGLTSYEGTKFQFQRAANDSRVKAIIADVETPGGQAIGAMELAQVVREVAKIKPVYAIANGMAASAGYAMISGATRIIVTPSGMVGSIGVVMLHLDQSEMLADAGIKPTFIIAGDHKVDGNSLQPLTDAVRDELRDEVKSTYELFLQTVAAGRGTRTTADQARATQARMFMGQAAVDAHLADAVGTFEEVLAEATAKARRSGGSVGSRSQGMTQLGIDNQGQQTALPAPAPAASPPAGTFTQADLDRAVAEATARATSTATTAAQTRLDTILASPDVAGRERAATAFAALNPTASADAVIAYVKEHVPLASAAATVPGIAARAAATNVGQVSGAPSTANPANPGGLANTEDEAIKTGWAAAQAAQQTRFKPTTKR